MRRVAIIGRIVVAIVGLVSSAGCHAGPRSVSPNDPASPLRLERTIALTDVKGRIDHLALDLADRVLFVAEYGNGSVDRVDLASGRVTGRIAGLHEPQGVAYLAAARRLVVASGDGSVRFYAGDDLHEVARLELGDDADNIRIDPRNGHVVVGYGSGGLAVIDPDTPRVIGRLPLPGHPEGFRMIGAQVLINVPDRGVIVAGDIDSGRVTARWPTGTHRLNFPLSVASNGGWFAVAYRLPAALARYDATSGAQLSMQGICGDADDLFVDDARIYVVCGAGHVDVVPVTPTRMATVRVTTASGARTGLFAPELHTLFVAAPARGEVAASISVLVTR
jgi:outer membrane protein assembly factor BamB